MCVQLIPDEAVSQELIKEVEYVIQELIAVGLIHTRVEQGVIPPDPLSPQERKILAIHSGYVPGELTSEMVIDEGVRNPR